MLDLFKPKSVNDTEDCSVTSGKATHKNSCFLYVNTTSKRITYDDVLKCIFNGNAENEYYQVRGTPSTFIIYFSTDDSNTTIGNKLTGFSLANDDCVTFHLFYGIQNTTYFIRDAKDVTDYVTNFFASNN